MKKNLVTLLTLIIVMQFAGRAQSLGDNTKHKLTDYPELESYINFRFENERYSGVTVIFQDSILEFSSIKGSANRDWDVNNTLDTKFDLASATKMFTAIGIAILYDQDRINLDAPFMKYFPSFPLEIASEITLRQLLSHTSGLTDLFFEEAYLRGDRSRLRKVSDYDPYFSELRIGHVPSDRIMYSNTNFLILGRIIEEVSGKNYYDFVHEQIFVPLNMCDTGFFEKDEVVKNRAVGYFNDAQASMEFGVPNDDQIRSNIAIRSIKGMPAGGAFSTVSDMNLFMNGIRSEKLISVETYKLFTKEFRGGYGLGFQVYEQEGQRVIGHSGGFYGVSTMIFYMPNINRTFISLTNTDFAAQPIFDRFLALQNDINTFRPISISSEELSQYEGYYAVIEGEMKGHQIHIQATGERLLFDNSLEFFPFGKDSFFDIDNDRFSLIFQRNENDEIIGFERGDGGMFVQVAENIDSTQVRTVVALILPEEILQEYIVELIFEEYGMMGGHRPTISVADGALLIDNMMKFLPYEKDKFFLHDDMGMKLHFNRDSKGEIMGAHVLRGEDVVGKLSLLDK